MKDAETDLFGHELVKGTVHDDGRPERRLLVVLLPALLRSPVQLVLDARLYPRPPLRRRPLLLLLFRLSLGQLVREPGLLLGELLALVLGQLRLGGLIGWGREVVGVGRRWESFELGRIHA